MKKWRFVAAMLLAAMVMSIFGAFALAEDVLEVKTTGSVYLRKGPGTGYAKITSVKKGRELEYTGISKYDSRGVVWHRVEYKTGYAWVSSVYSNVMNDDAALNDATYVETTASVNLRKGPGTGYKKLTAAGKGEKLFYLGEQAKDSAGRIWYKVSCSKGEAWLISQYAKIKTGGEEKQSYVKTTGSVNLRLGPGLGYESLEVIGKGEKLTYLNTATKDGRGVTWYKVEGEKYTGWVSSKYGKLVK